MSARSRGGVLAGNVAKIDVLAEHGDEQIGDVLALERPPAGEHFVEHDAKRPDVGALVDRLPFACSGDMYAAVPRIMPIVVMAGEVIVGDLRVSVGRIRRG